MPRRAGALDALMARLAPRIVAAVDRSPHGAARRAAYRRLLPELVREAVRLSKQELGADRAAQLATLGPALAGLLPPDVDALLALYLAYLAEPTDAHLSAVDGRAALARLLDELGAGAAGPGPDRPG